MNTQAATLRYLALLNCIPKYPHQVSTEVLRQKLQERGFEVSERTLQRDLNEKLSPIFPIVCREDTKPYRYGYAKDARQNLLNSKPEVALVFYMAKEHLTRVLPQTAIDLLTRRFDESEALLDKVSNNLYSSWRDRVHILPSGMNLVPAEVPTEIWYSVSDALLRAKKLRIQYRNAKKNNEIEEWDIHPQGLVSRHTVNYIIVRIKDYQNFMILALHRIQQAIVLDEEAEQCTENDLSEYLSSGELGWGQGVGLVNLVAEVSTYTASVLSETPLSADQSLEQINDDTKYLLKASVPKNKETLWWILGLNTNIKVLEPVEWVDEIKSLLSQQVSIYS